MHDGAQRARVHFRDAFIHRHHAAHVQRRVGVFIVFGKQLELRMQHGQLAGVIVELHLAEKRQTPPRLERLRQILPVEPLGAQHGARGVRERSFEKTQVAPAETRHARRAHLRHHCRHLAGRKLRDGLHVAPVLVAKRNVRQQIFDREQTLGREHGGARGTHALDVRERSRKIHWKIQCTMPKMKSCCIVLIFAAVCARAEIRLGIIGTDTSHVIAFTKILNDPSSPDYVPGARIVAAYKGGSPDVESSYTRVDKFAEELRTKWKIELISDIPALCRKVDGILLESVDGRVHLEQVKPVIAAHKPVFIDKPLAATLADAREIARLAKDAGVPWFSASDLLFTEPATRLKFPDITGAVAWGP